MIQSNSGKRVGFIALLSMAVLGASPWVFAETCGIPGFAPCCNTVASDTGAPVLCLAPANTKYEFTLKRFGLEKDDGTIEWRGSLTTFNAASVTVGQDMGNFISSANLALGTTIVAVRPEVSTTFTVNGGGQSNHTTTDSVNCSSGGDQTQTLTVDENNTTLPSCSTSPNAAQCETSDGFIRMRETSLGTFTVGTAPITIQFDFDVGSGLVFLTDGAGACNFNSMGPLNVTMTKQ